MPLCPACGKESAARRGGACPKCYAPVELIDGEWILLTSKSPPLIFLKHFELLVSDQQSARHNTSIVWNIPKRGMTYKIELGAAKKMIQDADDDISLALEALSLLFELSQFSWKVRTSLLQLRKDYSLTLAIARARCNDRKALKTQQYNALKDLEDREHIFS